MKSRRYRMIVHIGTEKTGTSTIQNVLYHNRPTLSSINVAYIHSSDRLDARALAAAAQDTSQYDDFFNGTGIETKEQREKFRDDIKQDFQTQLSQLPDNIDTVIISSEHFHSRLRSADRLEWLKSVLQDFSSSFEVILYLRPQASLVESFYSTQLRNGWSDTLESTAQRICIPSNAYYNYQLLLDLWSGVFGSNAVHPKKFERKKLKNQDILQDFLGLLNIDIDYSNLKYGDRRFNESIDPFGQDILLLLNRVTDKGSHGEIKRKIAFHFKGKGKKLPATAVKAIEEKFSHSNSIVSKNWFNSTYLFDEAVINSCEEGLAPFSEEKIVHTTEALKLLRDGLGADMTHLDKYCNDLRDLSISLETNDLKLAVAHMELAWLIRPRGPEINRKLGEYSVKLEQQRQPIKHLLSRWFK